MVVRLPMDMDYHIITKRKPINNSMGNIDIGMMIYYLQKNNLDYQKIHDGLVSSNLQTWSVTREGVSGNDLENIEFLKRELLT